MNNKGNIWLWVLLILIVVLGSLSLYYKNIDTTNVYSDNSNYSYNLPEDAINHADIDNDDNTQVDTVVDKDLNLCETVVCNDNCVGNILYYDGMCVDGTCEYNTLQKECNFRSNNVYTLKQGCDFNNLSCLDTENCLDNKCIPKFELPHNIIKSEITLIVRNLERQTTTYNKYDAYSEPDSKFRIVCQQPCLIPEILLQEKYVGARTAITKLINLTGGIDVDSSITPIDIHLNDDSYCSSEQMIKSVGFLTGHAGLNTNDAGGKNGAICLYDYEQKESRFYPFNEQYAYLLKDQVLLTHEYTHTLFFVRSASPEAFAKAFSFYVSGEYDRDLNDACDERLNTGSEKLIYLLCKNYGFQFSDVPQMMAEIVSLYESGAGDGFEDMVTELQIKEIIDDIVDADTSDAFIDSGWNLNNN